MPISFYARKRNLLIVALVAILALAAIPVASVTASGPGTWTAAASLGTARWFHTATLLQDGRVLAAAGQDSGYNYISSAELYDPLADSWTTTGSLATVRIRHTATLVTDGKVLVAGGQDSSGAANTAELYDPGAETWSTTGALASERYYHTATLLPDGNVLAAGGFDASGSSLASAEVYDPGTELWVAAASMSTGRAYQASTLLADGRVLVVGGQGGSGYLTSAEIYDPGTDSWSVTGSMGTARRTPTLTLLPDGRVLVAGGLDSSYNPTATAEVYDPISGAWSAVASMLDARRNHSATLLENGQVLVAGGFDGTFYVPGAELFDPTTGTWAATGGMLTAREQHRAVRLQDGVVLTLGGLSGGLQIASAERYEPLPSAALAFSPSYALVCDEATVSIDANDVTDLYGYQFEVTYDDTVVSASGAFVDSFFDTTIDASIPPGWDGTCAAGTCPFAVSKVDPGVPVTGSGTIAEITFTRVDVGEFDAAFSDSILSDRDANPIAHTTGTVHLSACGYADVSGVVILQGRPTPIDAGEVTLTDVGGNFGPYTVAFDATTGAFSIPGVAVLPAGSTYQFDAAHDLYLGNQMSQVLLPGDVYAAPDTTLKGGDADNSDVIDISDLTCIGGAFGIAPGTCGVDGSSDITADGSVNILDLVLPGGNYGLSTPQPW